MLRVALLAALGWSALRSAALIATQWGDARRSVEAFLAQLPAHSMVETYGLTVYQPRFDTSPSAPYRVQRVDKSVPARRNPLLGVREIAQPYMRYTQRRPDVLVVPEAYSTRYLRRFRGPGRMPSRDFARDPDAVEFFTAIHADRLPGYHTCLHAVATLGWLSGIVEPVRLHSSIGPPVLVLCRSR